MRKYRKEQCPTCKFNMEDRICEGSKRKDDDVWIKWFATLTGKTKKPCLNYQEKTVELNFGTPTFTTANKLKEIYK